MHAVSEMKKNIVQELEASFLKNFVGDESNSKKLKTYNIFDHDPDFKNHNGWSIAVTKKQLKSLKRTNIGFFMVHLSLVSDHNNFIHTICTYFVYEVILILFSEPYN